MARIRPLTIKQEKFAQEYVTNGGNATEAYKQAFDIKTKRIRTLYEAASKMLAKDKVRKRVKEIQAQSNKKYEISREMLTDKLMLCVMAGENSDKELLRKAAMDIAKLHGLIIDKSMIDNNHTFNRMGTIKRDDKAFNFEIGKPNKTNILIQPKE